MSGPTAFARYPVTLTITASGTTNSNWLYCHGYTKAEISGYWTGTHATTVKLQGTNDPASANAGTPQPSPDAVAIFDLATLTGIAPAASASTAGAVDDYDNVLPQWLRLNAVETGGAQGGTIVLQVVLKGAS